MIESPLRKIQVKSKPLKSSNSIINMTNGNTMRSRASKPTAKSNESHKLTEYFKEEIRSARVEPPTPILATDKTVKVENKAVNGQTNKKLTEYFPVRRSVRKTSKCVMAEKMRDLERAVREQREDGLQVSNYFMIVNLSIICQIKMQCLLPYLKCNILAPYGSWLI